MAGCRREGGEMSEERRKGEGRGMKAMGGGREWWEVQGRKRRGGGGVEEEAKA